MRNFEDCLKNDELSIKLRKSDRTLYAAGVGYMGLAIWSVVRLFLAAYIRYESIAAYIAKTITEIVEDSNGSIDESLAKILLGIVFGIILFFGALFVAFFLWLEVFIGLSACKESVGKKKGVVYLVFAFIMLAFEILGIYTCVETISNLVYGVDPSVFGNIGNIIGATEYEELSKTMITAIDEALDSFATLLLSITSTIILLELIINAFKVKGLRRKIAAGGKVNEH